MAALQIAELLAKIPVEVVPAIIRLIQAIINHEDPKRAAERAAMAVMAKRIIRTRVPK